MYPVCFPNLELFFSSSYTAPNSIEPGVLALGKALDTGIL